MEKQINIAQQYAESIFGDIRNVPEIHRTVESLSVDRNNAIRLYKEEFIDIDRIDITDHELNEYGYEYLEGSLDLAAYVCAYTDETIDDEANFYARVIPEGAFGFEWGERQL